MTPTKIHWNLMEIMSRRGVRFSSQLRDMLAECGVDFSVQHVNRLVSGTPKKLSMAVLGGLCEALSCTPGDLLALAPAKDASYAKNTPRRAARKAGEGAGGRRKASRNTG